MAFEVYEENPVTHRWLEKGETLRAFPGNSRLPSLMLLAQCPLLAGHKWNLAPQPPVALPGVFLATPPHILSHWGACSDAQHWGPMLPQGALLSGCPLPRTALGPSYFTCTVWPESHTSSKLPESGDHTTGHREVLTEHLLGGGQNRHTTVKPTVEFSSRGLPPTQPVG